MVQMLSSSMPLQSAWMFTDWQLMGFTEVKKHGLRDRERERESKNNHHLISLFFFSLNFGWGPFHCKDLWKGVGVSGGLGVVKLQLKQGGGAVVCSFFSASLHGNFVNSWEIHTLAAAQQRGRTVWKHNIVHRLTRTVRKSHSICCHPEMVSWGEIWLTRWSKSLGFLA